MKKWLKTGIAVLTSIFIANTVPVTASNIEYKTEMVKLIEDIKTYSQKQGKDDFILVANGGAGLFAYDEDNTPEQVERLANSIDGVMAEDIFYGYGGNLDVETPVETQEEYKQLLKIAADYNVKPMSLDYCTTEANINNSYKKNAWQKYLSWTSSHINLDNIPNRVPKNENTKDIINLASAKNYFIILDPEHYRSKDIYLSSIANTNYDLVIMDAYYAGEFLTADDLERIHYKANGGKRIVIAYMSVGQAEPYRHYWQQEWEQKQPEWLSGYNEVWSNYHVKYWRPEWKAILMGSRESYLDNIISAGFDGAFLDVVDAYQFFQQ